MESDLNRGPWVKSIWSKWPAKYGVNLPDIRPLSCDLLSNLNIHNRVLFSANQKEILEHKFSLTISDYSKEYDGKIPVWARIYKNRISDLILTARRDKKLVGYIIKQDSDGYRDKLYEFFYSGAYILTPDKSSYSHLNTLGIWCVEKELLRSRNKRLLVFRFLNNAGEVVRISSLRWDRGGNSKNVRVEDYGSDGGWQVTKLTSTNFEEESHNLDNFVLSL